MAKASVGSALIGLLLCLSGCLPPDPPVYGSGPITLAKPVQDYFDKYMKDTTSQFFIVISILAIHGRRLDFSGLWDPYWFASV